MNIRRWAALAASLLVASVAAITPHQEGRELHLALPPITPPTTPPPILPFVLHTGLGDDCGPMPRIRVPFSPTSAECFGAFVASEDAAFARASAILNAIGGASVIGCDRARQLWQGQYTDPVLWFLWRRWLECQAQGGVPDRLSDPARDADPR